MINLIFYSNLALVLIIMVIAFRTKNTQLSETKYLSAGWKVLLLVYIFICLPVIIFPFYAATMVYYVNHSGYWYQKTASAVNFHLYEIKPPAGLVIETVYKTGTSIGPDINNAVQTAINTPLPDQLSGSSALIIVRQAGVSADFDLPGFLEKINASSASAKFEQVKLTPSSTTAYLREMPLGNIHPRLLYFVTPDHVLVSISTPDQSNLFRVANSFFPGITLSPSIVIPSPTLAPTPTSVPITTPPPTLPLRKDTPKPTPAPQTSSKFQSSGVQELETGITAQITKVVPKDNTLIATIIYKNTSSVQQKVASLRVAIWSHTYGSFSQPSYSDIPLSPGQNRQFELSFELPPESGPYTFRYAKLQPGPAVVLGTYQ